MADEATKDEPEERVLSARERRIRRMRAIDREVRKLCARGKHLQRNPELALEGEVDKLKAEVGALLQERYKLEVQTPKSDRPLQAEEPPDVDALFASRLALPAPAEEGDEG